MKPIVLSVMQWNKLAAQLEQDYPPSVLLIRSVMKRKLGFTHRQHTRYLDAYSHKDFADRKDKPIKMKITEVHLDFYSEPKMSFFILKYSDYLTIERTNE